MAGLGKSSVASAHSLSKTCAKIKIVPFLSKSQFLRSVSSWFNTCADEKSLIFVQKRSDSNGMFIWFNWGIGIRSISILKFTNAPLLSDLFWAKFGTLSTSRFLCGMSRNKCLYAILKMYLDMSSCIYAAFLAPQTIRTLKKTRKPTIVSIKPSLKLDSVHAQI